MIRTSRVGTERIGQGGKSPGVGYKELLARDPDCCRIPADRNKSERLAIAGFGHVKNRNAIVIGIGHVEGFSPDIQCKAVRRRSGQGPGIYSRLQRFNHLSLRDIDYRNGIVVGVGYIKKMTVRTKTNIIRITTHGNGSNENMLLRV